MNRVYVLARDEAPNIAACLHSLSRLGWPVTVLDSGSTDATATLAGRFDLVVVENYKYRSHLEAYREITTERTPASGASLVLDADMRPDERLIGEIESAVRTQSDWEVLLARVRMVWEGVPLRRASLCPPKAILFRGGRDYFRAAGHGEVLRPDVVRRTALGFVTHDDRKGYLAYLGTQVRYATALMHRIERGEATFRDRLRTQTPLLVVAVPIWSVIVRGGWLDGRAGVLYALDRLIAEAVMLREAVKVQLQAKRVPGAGEVSHPSLADQRAFWEDASCGEALYLQGEEPAAYDRQLARRYELEPYIPAFAGFTRCQGRHVLEIGVGLGADHQRFAEEGARLCGVDLTMRSVVHVKRRFAARRLLSALSVGNAEALAFAAESFDLVYSWGVAHHTPNTAGALREAWRVLKPGGEARVMIYHAQSFVGYMLWLRYGLGRLRPFAGLEEMYSKHLESPGTKAYSVADARALFADFRTVEIRTQLTHGDLLTSEAGQRHQGFFLHVARLIWPRRFIRRFFPRRGLFMLIRAVK